MKDKVINMSKAILRDLVPPFIFKLLKRNKSASVCYGSYDDALEHCLQSYEDADLVKVVVEKNIKFRESFAKDRILEIGSLRTLVGVCLALPEKNKLRVLDFGGGGGYHYTVARAAITEDIDIQWNVVETSALVRSAEQINQKELRFFNSIAQAKQDLGDIDLVFTSGALHCCPDPLFLLEELVKLKARHLFITRTSFTDTLEQGVIIHNSLLSENGPGPLPSGVAEKKLQYPHVFSSRTKAENIIQYYYEIVLRINEDKSIYRLGNTPINMYGYYAKLKS
jgi:putative methyltransferase (TIGR04325 family)